MRHNRRNTLFIQIILSVILGLSQLSFLWPMLPAQADAQISAAIPAEEISDSDVYTASEAVPGLRGETGGINQKSTAKSELMDMKSNPGDEEDWWAAVQGDIRQSEYQITWQDDTYLSDVEEAYQAPNGPIISAPILRARGFALSRANSQERHPHGSGV